MAKGRPRTATKRKTNKKLAELGSTCEWWDGGCSECSLPWSHGKEGGCNGNPFSCRKHYYKYLASTENPKQTIIEEFERRH